MILDFQEQAVNDLNPQQHNNSNKPQEQVVHDLDFQEQAVYALDNKNK